MAVPNQPIDSRSMAHRAAADSGKEPANAPEAPLMPGGKVKQCLGALYYSQAMHSRSKHPVRSVPLQTAAAGRTCWESRDRGRSERPACLQFCVGYESTSRIGELPLLEEGDSKTLNLLDFKVPHSATWFDTPLRNPSSPAVFFDPILHNISTGETVGAVSTDSLTAVTRSTFAWASPFTRARTMHWPLQLLVAV